MGGQSMMKIKNTILLLVMMVLAPKAWALETDGEGYYIIRTVSDWNELADGINNGTITGTANARLYANIDGITKKIGYAWWDGQYIRGNSYYSGIFDGNGKTITVNLNGDDATVASDQSNGTHVAPFSHIKNATIKNICVKGTVRGKRHCSGLVSVAEGTNTITNAQISVDITATDLYCGGIIGQGADSNTTISDCLFNGSISIIGGCNAVSGIWGWSGVGRSHTANIQNCLENGTYSNITNNFNSIAIKNSDLNITTTNCFYTRANTTGNNYGTLATGTTLADGTVTAALQNGRPEEIWVQDPVTNKPTLKQFRNRINISKEGNGSISWNINTAPNTSEERVTLTVTPDEGYFLNASDLKVRLSVDGGHADARTRSIPVHSGYETVTNNGNGTFTFTLPERDYEYTANVTAVFKPVTVVLSDNSFTYNATEQKPVLTVTFDGSTTLTTNDYLATFSGESKDAGDYTVTITGQGDYVGTTAAYSYTIAPKTVGLTWSTPQTFEYDGTAKSLTATATGVESGDVCTVTVVSNSVPYYGYTATAGHQRPEYSTLIRHLVDNDLTTKWCPEWGTNKSGVLYVEFHTDELIYPIGYTFYTGGDTSTYPSRNPRSWRLLAKKTENEDWTPISTVEDNYSLEFANIKPYDFNLDVVGESYMYFRFEVSEHRDDKTDNFSSRHQLQLQDLHLNVPDNRNVGTHTMTATALSNPNYVLPEVKTQTITITPKEVSLTWTNTSLTYNGSVQKPTATAGGLITGDECAVTVSGEQTNANTGTATYTATASALSNSNYKLPAANTQAFTISPKSIGSGTDEAAMDITLTGIDESYVYTGSAIQPTVTLTYSQLPGENKTVAASGNYSVVYTDDNHDNVTVDKGGIVTVTGTGNYTGSIVKTFAITSKPFDETAITVVSVPNQTYNGTLLTPVVTLHDNNRDVDLTQGTDFSVTQHKDAGTHTMTITALGNYQATLTADFTIDPKEVGLEWQETRSFVYDGNAKRLAATATGLVGDDVCTVTVNYDKAPYFGSGKYTATRGSECYYLHLPQHLVDGDTLNTKWCPYGRNRIDGVYLIEFNTTESIYPVSYKLYNGGDAASFPDRIPKSWALKARKTTNDAWTTLATVTNDTRLEPINYNAIGYRGYEYNLDAAGESYQYYRFEVSERHTDYGNYTGQDEMQLNELILLTYGQAPIIAGEHKAYATALSNPNYKLPAANSQTFEITQRPVTLAWTDTGIGEDTKLIYNGSVQKPTATAGNLVGEDGCTVTVNGEQTDAGEHTATASTLSNPNYKLPEVKTTSYVIFPKSIGDGTATPAENITLTGIDESYVYTGSEIQPTVTLAYSLLPGENKTFAQADNYTVTYSDASHDNVTVAKGGIVTVTGTGNYTGSIVKTFAITKKPFSTDGFTISIPNQTYNKTDLTPVVTLYDVARGVNLTQETDFDVTQHKEAGTHTVTITGKGNYQATLTADFTIDPKVADLEWSNLEIDWDGTVKVPTATVTNLEDGDACTVTVGNGTATVGWHTAQATALDNTNYQLPADVDCQFEVVRLFTFDSNKEWMTFYFDADFGLEFLAADDYKDKIEVYVIKEVKEGVVHLLSTDDRIYKQTPLLLRRMGDDLEIRAHKQYTELMDPVSTAFTYIEGGKSSLDGYINNDNYTVYILIGSEFLLADKEDTSMAFNEERCFLVFPNSDPSSARPTLRIVIDDGTTGLSEKRIVNSEQFATDEWYSIDGRKLNGKPMKKGLYIRNGKKVVIK